MEDGLQHRCRSYFRRASQTAFNGLFGFWVGMDGDMGGGGGGSCRFGLRTFMFRAGGPDPA